MFRLFFKIFYGDALSANAVYFKNFFFSKTVYFYTKKKHFNLKFNSAFTLYFFYFILFSLLFYIIFIEFSILYVIKLDILNNTLKFLAAANYTNLNSVLLYLHTSNCYFYLILILIFFFFKKYF